MGTFTLWEQNKQTALWFTHSLTLLHFQKASVPTWFCCLFWIPGGLITFNLNVTLQWQLLTDGESHPHSSEHWLTHIQHPAWKNQNYKRFKKLVSSQPLSEWLTHWCHVWLVSFVTRRSSRGRGAPDHIKLSYSTPNNIGLLQCGPQYSQQHIWGILWGALREGK